MHQQNTIYGPLGHASGVHGGLNMVHVAPKLWKMAENGPECAYSWWGQLGCISELDQGIP